MFVTTRPEPDHLRSDTAQRVNYAYRAVNAAVIVLTGVANCVDPLPWLLAAVALAAVYLWFEVVFQLASLVVNGRMEFKDVPDAANTVGAFIVWVSVFFY